jgi:hypothetical protein
MIGIVYVILNKGISWNGETNIETVDGTVVTFDDIANARNYAKENCLEHIVVNLDGINLEEWFQLGKENGFFDETPVIDLMKKDLCENCDEKLKVIP